MFFHSFQAPPPQRKGSLPKFTPQNCRHSSLHLRTQNFFTPIVCLQGRPPVLRRVQWSKASRILEIHQTSSTHSECSPDAVHSAFLKHAFREVTSGFCKGTVPGASPFPSPGPLRMPKNISKETYSVPPEGHLLVKNM